MKKARLIAIILLFCSLFPSCQSVYIDPEESTEKGSSVNINVENEYFTDGTPLKKGDTYENSSYCTRQEKGRDNRAGKKRRL